MPARSAVYPRRTCRYCGNEHGRAEEHDAEHEQQEYGGAEVAVLQQPQVDDRVGVIPLPEDENDQQGDARQNKVRMQRRGEPVLLLALVEDELEAGDAEATSPRPMKSILGRAGCASRCGRGAADLPPCGW